MNVRESALWKAYAAHRYAILFYALLLTLIIVPSGKILGLPRAAVAVLIAFTLIAAVMPTTTPRTRFVFPVVVVGLLLARAAADAGHLPIAPGLVGAAIGLIGLLAAAGALRFVIKSGKIDNETIYASLSTYLLAGLFFAQIYLAIEQIVPGSISGPDKLNEASAVYYSFVTLATLGYGDFLPKSELARGVATFEVIGGQLYLAVMVARLIGLFGNPERPR